TERFAEAVEAHLTVAAGPASRIAVAAVAGAAAFTVPAGRRVRKRLTRANPTLVGDASTAADRVTFAGVVWQVAAVDDAPVHLDAASVGHDAALALARHLGVQRFTRGRFAALEWRLEPADVRSVATTILLVTVDDASAAV